MPDVYSDHYWQSEFSVTQADMDRLETYIAETSQAHELEALAKRIIRGRLRHGPEFSPTAQGIQSALTDQSVRRWDPMGEWQVGDHVIVAVGFFRDFERRHAPYIGEVTAIEGSRVKIRVAALGETRTYSTSESPQKLMGWHRFVEQLVASYRDSDDPETTSQRILLEHGSRIASQLLDSLRADERFVRLSGRWFLHRLAVSPSEEQLIALAWAILGLEEPQYTEDLLPLMPPPITEGDPGLFGLYLSIDSRPDLFANANPGQRPRWVLAGPPPGPAVAKYAAYDPDSHHVFCEPGERLDEDVARRLWELGLFRVVCQS